MVGYAPQGVPPLQQPSLAELLARAPNDVSNAIQSATGWTPGTTPLWMPQAVTNLSEALTAGTNQAKQAIQNTTRGLPGHPSMGDQDFNTLMALGMSPGAITAFHGSPHTFDAFDMSKIGTGEGAQAYGHGLYFADNPAVAQTYAHDFSGTRDYEVPETGGAIPRWVGHSLKTGGDRVIDSHIADFQNRLAEAQQELETSSQPWNVQDRIPRLQSVIDNLQAIKNGAATARDPSNLYHVSIDAEPEHFLDWDKPLSEQSPHVVNAVNSVVRLTQNEREKIPIRTIMEMIGAPSEASSALQQAGIPGIRYLDQGSRGSGEGTHNYVVFDPSKLNILERNGAPVNGAGLAQQGIGK